MKSTRFWVLLMGGLLAASLAATLLVWSARGEAVTAVVYQNGRQVAVLDLSQVDAPYSFPVEGPAGVNTVQVEPGRIRVSHADCPDQVCVRQGWISNGLAPIVCLPNKVIIQIEAGQEETDIDGVSG